jgi:hypothetical protein
MPIDLNELLMATQARGIERQSDSSTAYLQDLDRVFLVKFSEVDPVQAAAIKEIARGPAPAPSP